MMTIDVPKEASIRDALIDSAYRQGKGGMLMNFMAIGGVVWLHKILSGDLIHPVCPPCQYDLRHLPLKN